MLRDEHDRLLREIAGGGTPVGAEAMDARESAEQQVTEKILNQYGGILLFGDNTGIFHPTVDVHIAARPILSSLAHHFSEPIFRFLRSIETGVLF
jgi:hypothetical protein